VNDTVRKEKPENQTSDVYISAMEIQRENLVSAEGGLLRGVRPKICFSEIRDNFFPFIYFAILHTFSRCVKSFAVIEMNGNLCWWGGVT
jgi:hypothetical protein